MCYERRMKQLLAVFLVLFLFSPLSLAKTQKKIEVCKLTGELIHWQYHYCKALNETDDCEAMSVSSCVGDIMIELDGMKEKNECEKKQYLLQKRCDLYPNKKSVEYKRCVSSPPTVKQMECGA